MPASRGLSLDGIFHSLQSSTNFASIELLNYMQVSNSTVRQIVRDLKLPAFPLHLGPNLEISFVDGPPYCQNLQDRCNVVHSPLYEAASMAYSAVHNSIQSSTLILLKAAAITIPVV